MIIKRKKSTNSIEDKLLKWMKKNNRYYGYTTPEASSIGKYMIAPEIGRRIITFNFPEIQTQTKDQIFDHDPSDFKYDLYIKYYDKEENFIIEYKIIGRDLLNDGKIWYEVRETKQPIGDVTRFNFPRRTILTITEEAIEEFLKTNYWLTENDLIDLYDYIPQPEDDTPENMFWDYLTGTWLNTGVPHPEPEDDYKWDPVNGEWVPNFIYNDGDIFWKLLEEGVDSDELNILYVGIKDGKLSYYIHSEDNDTAGWYTQQEITTHLQDKTWSKIPFLPVPLTDEEQALLDAAGEDEGDVAGGDKGDIAGEDEGDIAGGDEGDDDDDDDDDDAMAAAQAAAAAAAAAQAEAEVEPMTYEEFWGNNKEIIYPGELWDASNRDWYINQDGKTRQIAKIFEPDEYGKGGIFFTDGTSVTFHEDKGFNITQDVPPKNVFDPSKIEYLDPESITRPTGEGWDPTAQEWFTKHKDITLGKTTIAGQVYESEIDETFEGSYLLEDGEIKKIGKVWKGKVIIFTDGTQKDITDATIELDYVRESEIPPDHLYTEPDTEADYGLPDEYKDEPVSEFTPNQVLIDKLKELINGEDASDIANVEKLGEEYSELGDVQEEIDNNPYLQDIQNFYNGNVNNFFNKDTFRRHDNQFSMLINKDYVMGHKDRYEDKDAEFTPAHVTKINWDSGEISFMSYAGDTVTMTFEELEEAEGQVSNKLYKPSSGEHIGIFEVGAHILIHDRIGGKTVSKVAEIIGIDSKTGQITYKIGDEDPRTENIHTLLKESNDLTTEEKNDLTLANNAGLLLTHTVRIGDILYNTESNMRIRIQAIKDDGEGVTYYEIDQSGNIIDKNAGVAEADVEQIMGWTNYIYDGDYNMGEQFIPTVPDEEFTRIFNDLFNDKYIEYNDLTFDEMYQELIHLRGLSDFFDRMEELHGLGENSSISQIVEKLYNEYLNSIGAKPEEEEEYGILPNIDTFLEEYLSDLFEREETIDDIDWPDFINQVLDVPGGEEWLYSNITGGKERRTPNTGVTDDEYNAMYAYLNNVINQMIDSGRVQIPIELTRDQQTRANHSVIRSMMLSWFGHTSKEDLDYTTFINIYGDTPAFAESIGTFQTAYRHGSGLGTRESMTELFNRIYDDLMRPVDERMDLDIYPAEIAGPLQDNPAGDDGGDDGGDE